MAPCKPCRPLLMVQPNGYANLPCMCHRRNPPQTPSFCFEREQSPGAERQSMRAHVPSEGHRLLHLLTRSMDFATVAS